MTNQDLKTQCTADPEGVHACTKCGVDTSNQRVILIGTLLCTKCSKQPNKLYGVVEYGHKTAGVLVMTESRSEFEELRKPANQRR